MGLQIKPRILGFYRGDHLHLEGMKETIQQKWHGKWVLGCGGGVRAFEEEGILWEVGRCGLGSGSCGLEKEDQAPVQASICP